MMKRKVINSKAANKNFFAISQIKHQNKASTCNKNLFAGDPEFKMNFWLGFLNPSTFNRFIKDKSFRNKFIYKIYLLSILVIRILIQLIYEIDFLKLSVSFFLSILGCLNIKYFHNYRAILKIFHIVFSISIIYLFKNDLGYIVFYIFQLEEFVSSTILLFYWPHYFSISILNIILIIWIRNSNLKETLVFIILCFFLNILYACVERMVKEDWVLYDSFKKSENSYNSLIQEIYVPIFVINEQSDILFLNSAGVQFLEELSNDSNKIKNLIKENTLQEYEESLKECLKTGMKTSAKVCLEPHSFNKEKIKDIIYYCKVKFKKIIWKGRSSRILITLKNINKKVEKDNILKNELIQIDNNLENTQNYLEKMAKISGTNECKKLIFSLKSLNSRLIAILMCKSKSQITSFKISDYLIRLFDIFFNANGEKKIKLKLTKDPYFPEEVTGDFRQFDIAISMLLSFILNNGNFYSVDLLLRMLDSTIDEYVLLLKFQCMSSIEFATEYVERIIDYSSLSITKLRINTDLELTQAQIDIIFCKKIVENDLKGTCEIISLPQKQLNFELKIKFSRNIDNKNCRIFKLFSPKLISSNSSYSYQWNEDNEEIKENSNIDLNNVNINESKKETLKKNSILRQYTSVENMKKPKQINIKEIVQAEIKRKELDSRNSEKLHENIIAKKKLIPLAQKEDFDETPKISEFNKRNLSVIKEEIFSARSMELNLFQEFDKILVKRPLEKEKISHKKLISGSRMKPLEGIEPKLCKTYRKNESFSSQEMIEKVLNLDAYFIEEMDNKEALPSISKRNYINSSKFFVNASKKINFIRSESSRSHKFYTEGNEAISKQFQDKHFLNCKESISLLTSKNGISMIQNKISHIFQDHLKNMTIRSILKRQQKTNLVSPKEIINEPIVLVVEDNDFQLNAQIMILKLLKVKYEVAKNGQSAVHFYEQKSKSNEFFTLILMDLIMPIMNGFEATRRIREMELENHYIRTYICGLSSDASSGVEEKCKKSGMDIYMQKPVGSVGLNELITKTFKSALIPK